ncbi:MAG: carbohydrate kinase family protein [Sphaerochaetaceae bacterium]
MSQDVLFVGDANLDLLLSDLENGLQEDKEVFCDECEWTLGGSCTLTAAAFARLGGSCDFCGLLGDDTNGGTVRDALVEAGVGVDLLRMDPHKKTGLTVNIIQGRNRTQITYPGSLLDVDETDTILETMGNYRHIHFSGVYGTKKFLPRIEEILLHAKKNHLTVSLETQWDATERWDYIERWLPHVDWLLINEDEAKSIASRLGAHGEVLRSVDHVWNFLLSKTPSPIIKMGKKGAFARGRIYPPCDVESITDTTGAGDSLAATFLYAVLVANYDFDGAMALSQAGGALACTFAGGYSSKFTLPAVEKLKDAGAKSS